jgi:hypothetical protein
MKMKVRQKQENPRERKRSKWLSCVIWSAIYRFGAHVAHISPDVFAWEFCAKCVAVENGNRHAVKAIFDATIKSNKFGKTGKSLAASLLETKEDMEAKLLFVGKAIL